ncbi:MAG TPA: hypothetical protein VLT16_10900, partial [Candidatus Limnocylindrales bacterium]|nr:hypothetical protein [Candidatus Limnocylindrales bacterium]
GPPIELGQFGGSQAGGDGREIGIAGVGDGIGGIEICDRGRVGAVHTPAGDVQRTPTDDPLSGTGPFCAQKLSQDEWLYGGAGSGQPLGGKFQVPVGERLAGRNIKHDCGARVVLHQAGKERLKAGGGFLLGG